MRNQGAAGAAFPGEMHAPDGDARDRENRPAEQRQRPSDRFGDGRGQQRRQEGSDVQRRRVGRRDHTDPLARNVASDDDRGHDVTDRHRRPDDHHSRQEPPETRKRADDRPHQHSHEREQKGELRPRATDDDGRERGEEREHQHRRRRQEPCLRGGDAEVHLDVAKHGRRRDDVSAKAESGHEDTRDDQPGERAANDGFRTASHLSSLRMRPKASDHARAVHAAVQSRRRSRDQVVMMRSGGTPSRSARAAPWSKRESCPGACASESMAKRQPTSSASVMSSSGGS